MARFDDYHRTVVGYHGTRLSVALRLVNRVNDFIRSERDYDWLGRGIYFWEYVPRQALNFAKIRQRQYKKKKNKSAEDERRANEPLAVVACMIRLGFCLDLTEPENVDYLSEIFRSYKASLELAGEVLPENNRKFRKLDRAVFEYAYKVIEESEPNLKVDTARDLRSDRRREADLGRQLDLSRHAHPALRPQLDESARNLAALSDWLGGERCL